MAGRNEPRSAAGRERARKRREEKSARGQPRSSSPNQKRLAVLLLVVVAVFYALGPHSHCFATCRPFFFETTVKR